jgi:putative NIF3 family GTP cyclohydrolase 1 type 2
MNLYVAQKSLDLARGFGTADALARAVQIAIQAPFSPDGEHETAVHGVTTGHLPDFVSRVSNRLGMDARAWKNSESFGHIGVVPGFAGKPGWLSQALSCGCDTYLTGEADMACLLYAREAGLNLVLAGHYATKIPGILALSTRIAQGLGLDVTLIPEELVETRG